MSECLICHKDVHGGVYTNGDGFGDAKHVGIVPPEWGFYCWDDYTHAPNINQQIDAAFAERNMCGFLEAWVGRCRNQKPCEKHQAQRCWKCGNAATRNCEHTGFLVCGIPECSEHKHEHGEGMGCKTR